jgi:hypothetical protein
MCRDHRRNSSASLRWSTWKRAFLFGGRVAPASPTRGGTHPIEGTRLDAYAASPLIDPALRRRRVLGALWTIARSSCSQSVERATGKAAHLGDVIEE